MRRAYPFDSLETTQSAIDALLLSQPNVDAESVARIVHDLLINASAAAHSRTPALSFDAVAQRQALDRVHAAYDRESGARDDNNGDDDDDVVVDMRKR